MTHILVTGGAGYIGSHTCQALLKAGYGVVILDDLSNGFAEAPPRGSHFVQGDIRQVDLVKNLIRQYSIEGIIHFAAKIIVPESINNALDYYDNNTVGVLRLLQACKETGVKKFVFSSTAAVYGERESGSISEDSPVTPLSPYGSSKFFSECIIRDSAAEFGLQSVVMRYFNVAGARLDGTNGQRSKNATHLIKLACDTAIGKRPFLNIFGTDYPTKDGTAVRDFIHVEDLSQLHVLAFQYLQGGGKSEIFNCGYGHGHSVREVVQVMKKISGNNFKVIETERRPGDLAYSVADNSKIRRILNWSPVIDDLEKICQSALIWEKRKDGLG